MSDELELDLETSTLEDPIRVLNTWDVLLPERRPLVRHNPDDAVLGRSEAPTDIWVLPAAAATNPLVGLTQHPTLLRDEYVDLLDAILVSLRLQAGDGRPAAPLLANTDAVNPREIRVQKRVPSPSSQPFRNPFQEDVHRHLTSEDTALVITGLPGIGKTRFLVLLFHLRVAANLPTLFMANKSTAYFYKNHQLGAITGFGPTVFADNIPPSTWCLIDTNDELVTIPRSIIDSGRFIVQTASPRAEHMKYTRKLSKPHQCCVMKPWSLAELVAGLSLQPHLHRVSETNVKAFYDRFGGAARILYRNVFDPKAFEAQVDDAARAFDGRVIEDILRTPDIAGIDVPGGRGGRCCCPCFRWLTRATGVRLG
ncbi:hypothetical protein C8R43DRAFT_1012709 [Mycena crocata]|nr:hypothetical protein C8R43DRAFT_1012709 [Mycena crocata]